MNEFEVGLMNKYDRDAGKLTPTEILQNEYAALRAQLAEKDKEIKKLTEWVSINDGLPKKETTEQWEMYLCKINRYGEILVCPLAFYGGSWYSDSHYRYDEFVTDWRELPKP